jgi:hypothetical protein
VLLLVLVLLLELVCIVVQNSVAFGDELVHGVQAVVFFVIQQVQEVGAFLVLLNFLILAVLGGGRYSLLLFYDNRSLLLLLFV